MTKTPNNWYSIPGYCNKSRWNTKRTVSVKYINLNDIALFVGADNSESRYWIMNTNKTILSNEILTILKGQVLLIETYNNNTYTLTNNGIIMNSGIIYIQNSANFVNNVSIKNIGGGKIIFDIGA